MLNISRVANFLRKGPSLFVSRSGSFFLLLIICVSALAQSGSDLAATYDWLKSKEQDPDVKAALRRSTNDPCDWQKGPGPYDPLACIGKQKEEWSALSNIARGDAQASATVRQTIQKIVEGLNAREKQWRALAPAEKNRHIAIRKEILEAVKSTNNLAQGLRRIIDDPNRSQETHHAARGMLAAYERGGGSGPDGTICFPTCVCVGPDPCPCACWDLIIGRWQ